MYYFSTLTLAYVLMVLSHIRATESVQLFPYGEMDNALYIGDDGFQSVDLDAPLTYFGTTYTSVYVSIPHAYLFFRHHLENIQSNFNGSNIFGTIENCSRHG